MGQRMSARHSVHFALARRLKPLTLTCMISYMVGTGSLAGTGYNA